MSPSDKEPESKLFNEVNALRRGGGPQVDQDALDRAKLNSTIFGKLAANKQFEYTTLSIIVLNAAFIGYDADFSARWEKPENLYDCSGFKPSECYQFIIFENIFAVYFTFEVVVRFLAYKKKLDSIFDMWFVFDSTLVLFMIVETWILPIVGASGPLAQLSVLRLLRLLRITRMAKLMRFFPELQIILKGMVAAVRSVLCTAILMIMIMYVWSILFTSEFHQGDLTEEEVAGLPEELFGTMEKSMRHLFIMGTILDDITLACNYIRGSKKSFSMMFAFISFVLIASFTMLNMLIGILCEVVCATGEGERHKNTEASVRDAITNLFKQMDVDNNGEISRSEFLMMRRDRNVMQALAGLDVETKHFEMYAEVMFKEDPDSGEAPTFDFEKTIGMIMRLRPGTKVSSLDFASFERCVLTNREKLLKHLDDVENLTSVLVENVAKQGPLAANSPVNPLQQLEKKSDREILAELQRRLGVLSLGSAAAAAAASGSKPTEAEFENSLPQWHLPNMPGDVTSEGWCKEIYTC